MKPIPLSQIWPFSASLMYFQMLPYTQDALPELTNGFRQLHLLFKSLNALVLLLHLVGQWFELLPCLNSLFCQGSSPKTESIWAGRWRLSEMGAFPNPPHEVLHFAYECFPLGSDLTTQMHSYSFSLYFNHMELL